MNKRCVGCGLYPNEIDSKKEWCEAGSTLGHHMIDVDDNGMAIDPVDRKWQESEDATCNRCGAAPCSYADPEGRAFCSPLCKIKYELDPEGFFL